MSIISISKIKNIKVHVYTIWALWSLFFYIMMTTFLPGTVGPVSYKIQRIARSIMPQGWAFFTKSPREILINAYRINNKQLIPITFSNSSLKNLMGFSRSSRYVGIELGMIVSKLPKDGWVNSQGDFNSNIPKISYTLHTLKEFAYFPKGDYIIIKYRQIPWAWARDNQSNNMPYLVQRVNISYKNGR